MWIDSATQLINRSILKVYLNDFSEEPVNINPQDHGLGIHLGILNKGESSRRYKIRVIPNGGANTGSMFHKKSLGHRMPAVQIFDHRTGSVVFQETLYPTSEYFGREAFKKISLEIKENGKA